MPSRSIGVLLALILFAAILVAGAAHAPPARAQTAWPTVRIISKWSGMTLPLYLTHAGDDTGRVFVVEKAGRVRLIKNGSLVARPFLDISGVVDSTQVEMGLFSIAFPPGYATSKRFYACYSDKAGNLRISRFNTVNNRDVASKASEHAVLTYAHPNATHWGGQIAFGPIGPFNQMYVAMGDGGSGAPSANAQDTGVLLGKVLRIDVESSQGATYSVPPSNPFVGDGAYRPEIWALGLRNPWRFSFDRQNGNMFMGDVGQNSWEEVNVAAAGVGGQNYGWNRYEGRHPYPPASAPTTTTGLTWPIKEVAHPDGEAVIGGYVYRGTAYRTMRGIYFFGDWFTGTIWGVRWTTAGWERRLLRRTSYQISSFGEDQAGNVYFCDYQGGGVYLLRT